MFQVSQVIHDGRKKLFILHVVLITLQQEAEDVEQEEDARTVQVGEETFIVHDRKFMSCDIADYVRNANDNQEQSIHQARYDEQWRPVNEKKKL